MFDITITHEILRQLGGREFVAMTGARNISHHPNCLIFQLPRSFAKNEIYAVKIELKADDTYTVKFFRPQGLDTILVSEHSEIYTDQLQDLFREVTGLETKFPIVRFA